MHMHMIIQFLVPCMENLDDPELSLLGGDKLTGRIGSHGTGRIVTVGEKEHGGPAIFKPVAGQDIKGVF